MSILLITVGSLKKNFSYLQPGIRDYLQRLNTYTRISLVEVQDSPVLPSKTSEQIMAQEADYLMPYIEKASYTIALSEHGQQMNSSQFSTAFFDRAWANRSNGGFLQGTQSPIIVIVGGALGLHPNITTRCNWTVSLSCMTFPHPMVRLIILEQLYRAFKIYRNEPYHK
jgi:23S rRNA (pseudouridine1915-N3)-methyltransferase